MEGLNRKKLVDLYVKKRRSSAEISKLLGLSQTGVNYWLRKFGIPKRNLSEAIYVKHHPNGDPFKFILPRNVQEAELFGLGVGLYWGEGTKANKSSVRLGNSDPKILKTFISFLVKFFNIERSGLRFHLHTFTDINLQEAKKYWIETLEIGEEQFYKPLVTITGKLGNYRKKSKYGVLTVYYNNKKLRDSLVSLLPM